MNLTPKEQSVLKLIEDPIYQDYFFKNISDIKWFDSLKQRDYFSPDKAPNFIEAKEKGYYKIPQWNVLPYLEKISQQVNIPENEKYIDELLNIIKKVSSYKDNNKQYIDNYRTWTYFIKILVNLPNEKISDEILDLIPIWLNSKFGVTSQGVRIATNLLPKFLSDNSTSQDIQKAEKIIDIITEIKWVPKYTEQQKKEMKEKYADILNKPQDEMTDEEKLRLAFLDFEKKEPKMAIDTYWLIESFINKKNAVKIGEKCSENIIYNLANKLMGIFEQEYPEHKDDYSYIWLPSLFNVSKHIYSNPKETLTLILKDIFLSKAKNNKEATQKIIDKFLSKEYPYPLFQRLVLYVIGMEWNIYKDVFWEMIKEDTENSLFNDSHFSKFPPTEKENIKYIIENKVPREPHPEEDLRFEESGVHVGPGPSPLTIEDILGKSNTELAAYLKTFRTMDPWKGPTVGGLSDILKRAAEEKPEKFVEDLEPFLETAYLYISDILWGILNAWKKKKTFDWKKFLEFIRKYIDPEDFWNDNTKYKSEDDFLKANHLWVINMIGELIVAGYEYDAWLIPEEHFDTIQNILFFLLDNMLPEKEKILKEHPIRNGFLSYALNSSFGKITEALIKLTFRIKKIEDKFGNKQSVGWEIDIKKKYEKLLANNIVESYVWLGVYLPNFYTMDKEWTKKKIETITPEKGQLWKAFMSGYLYRANVYDELYELMKSHYENMLNYGLNEEHSADRFVQHICIGYLREIEKIDNTTGLFRKILDKWNPAQIESIIGFFWMQRDYLIESIQNKTKVEKTPEIESFKKRIIDFWEWVYKNKYKNKTSFSKEEKEILSELAKLTVFLPEINNENAKWLQLSAPYVNIHFTASFFIEYLNELKDKGASYKYVGKIFLEILYHATPDYPDYKEEDISSIVKFLYDTKKEEQIKDANDICNLYFRRSSDYKFLKSIYDEHNK